MPPRPQVVVDPEELAAAERLPPPPGTSTSAGKRAADIPSVRMTSLAKPAARPLMLTLRVARHDAWGRSAVGRVPLVAGQRPMPTPTAASLHLHQDTGRALSLLQTARPQAALQHDLPYLPALHSLATPRTSSGGPW